MSDRHPFENALAESWPPDDWSAVTTLVAVSGGPDSVALLRGLCKIRAEGPGRLIVVHVDHRLRAESGEDRGFVEALTAQLGCGFECLVSDSPTTSEGDGVEAAAREQRYEFFREVAGRSGARFVATAHSADDQLETILHRLLRGTGLHGAAGIPRARELTTGVALIRPMLTIDRHLTLDYLHAIGQPFCVDATNESDQFLRNRIRHQLIPLLCELQPNAKDSLLRFGELARGAAEVLEQLASERAAELVQTSESGVRINAEGLSRLHPYLAQLVLQSAWRGQGWPEQAMTKAKWEQLRQMAADTATGATTLPSSVEARRRGPWLDLAARDRA